jgi:hypothetical protein
MLPTQEGFGERLCDEVKFEEQAQSAPAQAFGEASGIVHGEAVELPGGIESALRDESVEVGTEAKRIAEGRVGHCGGGGDGSAGCGGVELRDQVEDQSCKVCEQALIMAEEDPQGLGEGEDEPSGGPLHRLTVGEGKEQRPIEVLSEQESSLLAT